MPEHTLAEVYKLAAPLLLALLVLCVPALRRSARRAARRWMSIEVVDEEARLSPGDLYAGAGASGGCGDGDDPPRAVALSFYAPSE